MVLRLHSIGGARQFMGVVQEETAPLIYPARHSVCLIDSVNAAYLNPRDGGRVISSKRFCCIVD